MTINRNNYESYLVDFLDGNLSKKLVEQVEHFLTLNPDIREEFDCFSDNSTLIPEVQFDAKTQLKKIPYSNSDAKSDFFQQQCVARIDNLLTNQEIVAFNESLKEDLQKQHEFDLFSKAKLNPENYIFNEKLTLKQAGFSHVINPDNFEEYCVACVEGWLSQTGLVALNKYLEEHPQLQNEYELYSKLKLKPDYSIQYQHKRSLKKFWILPLKTSLNISVAASVAAVFVFGYFVLNNPDLTKQLNAVATLQPNKTKIEINNSQSLKNQKKKTKPVVFAQNKIEQKRNIATQQDTKKNQEPVYKKQNLNFIIPKTINNIECKNCIDKEVKTNPEFLELTINKKTVERINTANRTQITPKRIVTNILIAGAKSAEFLTNGKVRVKKDVKHKKTTIGFNSRFLAFSTSVNSRNIN